MQCLVFAHRAEAQVFLEQRAFKPIKDFNHLYRDHECFLFITGEGFLETLCKITSLLTQFPQITSITNLGIAGALDSKLQGRTTHSIRTIYGSLNQEFQFKSFSSINSQSQIDCISCDYRVNKAEQKNALSAYAQIVDRELWAIAYASTKKKIPWQSLKCISDQADDTYSCQSIKEKAEDYSRALYENWIELSQEKAISQDEIKAPDSLYFTFSQQKRYESLIKKYQLKTNQTFSQINKEVSSLFLEESLPKKRTKKLLEYLSIKVNPLHHKAKEKIEQSLGPLKKNHIQYKYDPQLESEQLEIKLQIKNSQDLEKAIEHLSHFNMGEFQKSFRQF